MPSYVSAPAPCVPTASCLLVHVICAETLVHAIAHICLACVWSPEPLSMSMSCLCHRPHQCISHEPILYCLCLRLPPPALGHESSLSIHVSDVTPWLLPQSMPNRALHAAPCLCMSWPHLSRLKLLPIVYCFHLPAPSLFHANHYLVHACYPPTCFISSLSHPTSIPISLYYISHCYVDLSDLLVFQHTHPQV